VNERVSIEETDASLPRTKRTTLEALLAPADVRVNGDRPWDMRIRDSRAIDRSLGWGNLGLGESFMAGWVEIDRVDQFADRVLRAGIEKQVGKSPRIWWHALKARLFNHQSKEKAWEVGEHPFHDDERLRRVAETADKEVGVQYRCDLTVEDRRKLKDAVRGVRHDSTRRETYRRSSTGWANRGCSAPSAAGAW